MTHDWLRITLSFAAAACFSVTTASAQVRTTPAQAGPDDGIVTIPEKLDSACRLGRAKLYDECTDQLAVFETARMRAAAENKVLLVSYGAEWCIWCHVFDKYIHGEKSRFEYAFGSPGAPEARKTATLFEREREDVTADATALNKYVGNSFVIAHIDAQYAPNSLAVLQKTGAASHAGGFIPFIFVVDRDGRYAGHINHDLVEVRRDTNDPYRGYDRRKLLTELQRVHAAASR